MKKKVAAIISARYYLRNFLLKTLYQRSLGYCRKEARLLGHCSKEARLLGHCRRQMRPPRPRSRGVTLSRGVLLMITISHRSPIDLPSLITNR